MKAREAKESGHELVCALMLDEMAIKKHVQWDGTRFHGYVDLGTERDDDDINPSRSSASLIDISRILRKSTSNMTEYALIEFTDDNSFEVVHTADIKFENDGMLQTDVSAWHKSQGRHC